MNINSENGKKSVLVTESQIVSEKTQDWDEIREGGRRATQHEKDMPVLVALSKYKMAAFWTFAISLSTIMEGYDESLIGTFFGLRAFRKKFGAPFHDDFQLTPAWQSGLGMVSPVGVVLGLLFSGQFSERWGPKKLICTAYVATMCFVFLTFFANSKAMLLVGELLSCICFGTLAQCSLAYASEICPLALRSYFTMWSNFTFTIGHTIKAAIMVGFSYNNTQWSYRAPFAIQWVWPIPLFIAAIFAPDSPWWLCRKGKYDEARKNIRRLAGSGVTEKEIDDKIAMMLHTVEHERELEYGTSYWECFNKDNIRRTEIACLAWVAQNLTGFGGPGGGYFFEQVGFSQSSSFWFGFVGEVIALAGDVTSWMLVGIVGRRTLYLCGLSYITVHWFVVGFLSLAPPSNHGAKWGQAVLLTIQGYFYDVTVGPLAFTIASESGSSRLRGKTISLARSVYYIVGIINSVIGPYELNPEAWNLKGKSAFIPAVLTVFALVWAYFRLPEYKGRTFEEIDSLFDRGISARKFASTHVDVYADEAMRHGDMEETHIVANPAMVSAVQEF